MNTVLRSLFAALCLTAPSAHGAALSYMVAYRYLESGQEIFESTDSFVDSDRTVAGLDSIASQRSVLGMTNLMIASRIAGTAERGAAFFKISFQLDEPSAWSLKGSFELIGSTGFTCVSFQDLAHRDTLIVNEVLYAPPRVSETRTVQFGGVLEAGSYALEAMIYGGGDDQFTRGGVDVAFSIPEPRASVLLTALLFVQRRR